MATPITNDTEPRKNAIACMENFAYFLASALSLKVPSEQAAASGYKDDAALLAHLRRYTLDYKAKKEKIYRDWERANPD